MKTFNKLVRDNIPDIIMSNGEKAITKTLNETEYLKELHNKLSEEVNEYLESGDIIELADVYEVILALLKAKGIKKDEFEMIRKDKVLKNGAFDKRIFLISTI